MISKFPAFAPIVSQLVESVVDEFGYFLRRWFYHDQPKPLIRPTTIDRRYPQVIFKKRNLDEAAAERRIQGFRAANTEQGDQLCGISQNAYSPIKDHGLRKKSQVEGRAFRLRVVHR